MFLGTPGTPSRSLCIREPLSLGIFAFGVLELCKISSHRALPCSSCHGVSSQPGAACSGPRPVRWGQPQILPRRVAARKNGVNAVQGKFEGVGAGVCACSGSSVPPWVGCRGEGAPKCPLQPGEDGCWEPAVGWMWSRSGSEGWRSWGGCRGQVSKPRRGVSNLRGVFEPFPRAKKRAPGEERGWGFAHPCLLPFGTEFRRRPVPAELGTSSFPTTAGTKPTSCPRPAAPYPKYPRPRFGCRGEAAARPGLHVCRFHVRSFPRKLLALHVCRFNTLFALVWISL